MKSGFSYRLPSIPYLRLRFHLTAEQECTLPEFKGSLLRGAFGHALRRTVCVMQAQQLCESCMLRAQCAYTRLFECFIEQAPPRFLRGLQTAPRPYVIEPFDLSRKYAAGEALQFDFILIGQAIEMYPYAIFAISKMAENGLGRQRHRFTLSRVDWQTDSGPSATEEGDSPTLLHHAHAHDQGVWDTLYDGVSKRILAHPYPRDAAEEFEKQNSRIDRCILRFQTPTRLKFKDELTMDFTFRMLVFKMLRRVLEIAHFHVPDAKVDWEFHDLLVAADECKVVKHDLRWVDWERRSHRQKANMKMGGFVGELVLRGELTPFMPLLVTSEVVHVGKGAVFGNGKVEIL